MKKTLLILLLPLLTIGQTQIGADIDGITTLGYSGRSVSLSSDGTILAIGAPSYPGNGAGSGSVIGSVSVYKNVSGTWTKIGADINGEAAGDESGISVSLSSDGSVLAIGAPENDGNGTGSGSVRVYKNISGTWTKVGADIDGEAAGDLSGYSVSLSDDGSVLAIGAPNNGSGLSADSGSVRVYKNISGTWTKVGSDIDGEVTGNESGRNVSLSADGSILAIGAPTNNGNGHYSGSVRVYKNISGTWTKVGADIDGEAAEDQSGWSVSLSSNGSVLAIGSIYNDKTILDNSGSVRVYKNVSGTWAKVGADIDGEANNDTSGFAISLSADGTILAIGAYGNDGNVADSESGSVRVYKNVSGTWTKVGVDIDGEAAFDRSGHSVSLSDDGTILAIGAPNNDENVADSGSVRVYNLSAVLSSDSFVLANFSVYPNPASEVVTISLEEGLTLEKVNVYNTLGQLVKTEKANSISVNSFVKGSYFFEVITNKGKATKQIIVQ